jgi:hypothetical protein
MFSKWFSYLLFMWYCYFWRQLLWKNLTESVSRACSPQSEHLGGLISSVMNQLSPTLPPCTVLPSKGKRAERTPCTVYHQQNPYDLPFTVVSSSLPTVNQNSAYGSWMANNMNNIVIPPKGLSSSIPYANGLAPLAGSSQGGASSANLVNIAPLALVTSNLQSVRSPQSLVMPTHFLQRSKVWLLTIYWNSSLFKHIWLLGH